MISPSDWVLIGCTMTLAVIALFGPYLNDFWKRKSLTPKLKIIFHKELSSIRASNRTNGYCLFFEVKNEGNSKAKNCEAIIEKLYFRHMGKLIEQKLYIPAKVIGATLSFDILPKASSFHEIFDIVRNDQNKIDLKLSLVPLIRYNGSKEVLTIPLDYLKIKIVTYSENAKKCVQQIEINSPGIWRNDIKQIIQEMQITSS